MPGWADYRIAAICLKTMVFWFKSAVFDHRPVALFSRTFYSIRTHKWLSSIPIATSLTWS
jgi:hypothetical protein